MLRRMFHRPRGGHGDPHHNNARATAPASGRRGAPAPHRAWAATAQGGQWWRGAFAGAMLAFAVCGGWNLLRSGGGSEAVKSTELMDFVAVPADGKGGVGGEGGATKEKDGEGKQCPVFNEVTGEITIPGENPPKKIEDKVICSPAGVGVTPVRLNQERITPGARYPIQSKEWGIRIDAAKRSKSTKPKGASANDIGRTALANRFLPSTDVESNGDRLLSEATGGKQSTGRSSTSPTSSNHTLSFDHQAPGQQQQQNKRGGIAAVLTLLGGASGNENGPMIAQYEGVLGDGGGKGRVLWEEVIVCRGQDNDGGNGGATGSSGAWSKARDRGVVKVVGCGNSHNKGEDEPPPPPPPATTTTTTKHGEVWLVCAASDAATAEWLWVPGPAIASALTAMEDAVAGGGGGEGREETRPSVIGELFRLATRSDVSGTVFGVMGWVRTRPKVGSEWGSSGKEKWHFIAGGGAVPEGMEETVAIEVDALASGIFVKGSHLRAACDLMRGNDIGVTPNVYDTNKHGSNTQTNGSPPAVPSGVEIDDAMKLSSVSYVLRRTLGVRSYVARTGAAGNLGTALMAGGGGGGGSDGGVGRGEGGGGTGSRVWSWILGGGGEGWGVKGVDMIAGSQLSVPGSELLPWDCLVPSRREAVLLVVSTPGDVEALKPLLLAFHESGFYDPYVVLEDGDESYHHPQPLSTRKLYQEALRRASFEIFAQSSKRSSGDAIPGSGGSNGKGSSKTAAGMRTMAMPHGQCGTVMMSSVAASQQQNTQLEEDMIYYGDHHQSPPRRSDKEDPTSSLKRKKEEKGETLEGQERSWGKYYGSDAGGGGGGGGGGDDVKEKQGWGGWGRGRRREGQWAALLERFSPVAVVAVGGKIAEGDTEGERAARRACERAKAPTSYIRMPAGDAAHAVWLTRLAPEALASWARPRFSVSVITNDRPQSLRRLLESLLRSRLFGDQLSVDFYVESSADDETLSTVKAFSSFWGERGPVQTHFRVLKGGLIRAVTESFYPSNRDHHAFLLEDDIEVSPHFYAWAKYATLTYQYGAAKDFAPDMYGVSLYTPRVNEIFKKRYTYDSNKLIAKKTKGEKFSPYLHQTPCSWGAVYFPESWMEYRLYLAARLLEDHISVNIKDSKTNRWKTSWKRFYIEMAFQAEYYMLYPNYFNQTSLATNWLEAGEHIKVGDEKGATGDGGGKGNRPSPPVARPKGDKGHRPEDYTVPLLEDSESLIDPLPGGRLPPVRWLPRMDVLNNDVKSKQL